MRIVNPTENYRISLPDGVAEDYDGRVASYWQEGHSLLLQISTYVRHEGSQICAAERLAARLKQDALLDVSRNVCIHIDSPDAEAASGFDGKGVRWVYVYAVWLDLTILISVSGIPQEFGDNNWAFDAISSIRRVGCRVASSQDETTPEPGGLQHEE